MSPGYVNSPPSRMVPTPSKRSPVWIAVQLLVFGFPTLLLFLWLLGFVDPARDQSKCSFGTVGEAEFQKLVNRASAQDWTVWPGLSDGWFAPSDRGVRPATGDFEKVSAEKLRGFIRELLPDRATSDHLLAASHALMRSIGAEYVRFSSVPIHYENKKVVSTMTIFMYVLPQRRFAPLCLPCFVWPSTDININLSHDLIANTFALERVTVNHHNILAGPTPTRAAGLQCPRLSASQTKQ